MCRNVAGVAYPTTPFSSVHAGVLQVGTITAALAQIADAAIETAKIKDLAVETLKIKDQAVTVPVSAFTAADVGVGVGLGTVQSLEIETSGAPVHIQFSCSQVGTNLGYLYCFIYRDDTLVYTMTIAFVAPYTDGPIAFNFSDAPGADTYTYYVKAQTNQNSVNLASRSLFVIETKK